MPRLEITVQGHLLVAGGQTSESGADLATARRLHEGRLIPYIPATALRGAVRIQLEALLKGGGYDAEVVEPYPFDARPGQPPPDATGAVARLFGFSGPTGKRHGSAQGALRFSDALPIDLARAEKALRIRPGVELADFTATAEDRKLFFREVAEISAEPLVFQAHVTVVEPAKLEQRDLERLRAAVETTDAIGAGKAKGGGEVSIRWLDEEAAAAVRVQGDAAAATRARLLVTLVEPAHFGDGGPYANHHATRTLIPGATVRGAVAWTLLRGGRARPEDEAFKALFLGDSPASFGDALLVHEPAAEPAIFSATARQRRGAKDDVRNILVTELARQRVNEALPGSSLYLRTDDGEDRLDSVAARPSEGLVRRTRTRVSIDRWTGAAADGRLFSIEQIEPTLSRAGLAARFVSRVEGLTPVSAGLLEQLAGLPVLVGAGRNHGLGLVAVDVQLFGDPEEAPAEEKVRSFAVTVDKRVADLCRRAGVASTTPPGGRLPLVLVALADYVPSLPGINHPLAEPDLAGLPVSGPDRRFLDTGATGGYDQWPRAGNPLKDLLPAVGAGSVFVYTIAEDDLQATLDRMLPVLRRGVGRRVDSGCGRFGLFEPEAAKESTMSPQPENGLKTWMVEQAAEILDGVKNEKDFRNATAQLRNLVQITQRESEVAVLENFLNYQRGRRATRDFWRLIHGPVVAVLKEIEQRTSDQGAEARRAAIQQFFGYLVRHYIYLDQLNADQARGSGRRAAAPGRPTGPAGRPAGSPQR
jgi:CRISPR/Cas system CSM-associated protein Csm3 (group 7 of RAMP superfamily)